METARFNYLNRELLVEYIIEGRYFSGDLDNPREYPRTVLLRVVHNGKDISGAILRLQRLSRLKRLFWSDIIERLETEIGLRIYRFYGQSH